jgi:S-disulfanyl-L-cysteine oxidoreductase SoxD
MSRSLEWRVPFTLSRFPGNYVEHCETWLSGIFTVNGLKCAVVTGEDPGHPASEARWPDSGEAEGGVGRLRSLTVCAVGLMFWSGLVHPSQAQPQQKLGIGREATAAEIAGWAIAVRPDGKGLPPGKGTVSQGEEIFQAQCATCHGEFGEGKDRWPVLAGGLGSLKHDRPEKTIGSYWPYASTVFDYVRRAMPFGNAQSLSGDELYAVTAYLLFMNDVIKDGTFELNQGNFSALKMPNAEGFYDDDRERAEKQFWNRQPCMTECRKDAATVLNRASVLDVTPDQKTGPKVE